MQRPDFAHTNLLPLADSDVKFLIDNFPEPGHSYEEISQVMRCLPTVITSYSIHYTKLYDQPVKELARTAQVIPLAKFRYRRFTRLA